MNNKYKPNFSFVGFLAKGFGRIVIAVLMVGIGFAAILWDQGYYSLPFIGRGKGITERISLEDKPETKEYIFDYDAYAEDIMLSFIRTVDALACEANVSNEKYNGKTVFLTLKEIGTGEIDLQNGYFRTASENGINYTYPLSAETVTDGFIPTAYFDENGNQLYSKDEKYYYYNSDLYAMIESNYIPADDKLPENNKIKFPEGFEPISYSEGIYLIKKDGYFAYYSESEKMITSPKYATAYPFREGLAVVTNEDGKFGVIDSSGKEVIGTAFDSISDFCSGFSLMKKGEMSYLLVKVKGSAEALPKPPKTSSKEIYTKSPLVTGTTVSTTKTIVIEITEGPDFPMWPELPPETDETATSETPDSTTKK